MSEARNAQWMEAMEQGQALRARSGDDTRRQQQQQPQRRQGRAEERGRARGRNGYGAVPQNAPEEAQGWRSASGKFRTSSGSSGSSGGDDDDDERYTGDGGGGGTLSKALDAQSRAVFNASSLANPTPLGLFSFGVVTLLTAFDKFGATLDTLYMHAILVGGVGQFVAGIFDFYRNNTLGATTFVIFGSYWISQAAHTLLTNSRIDVAPTGKAAGYACFYAVWTLFGSLTLVQTVRTNLALFATIALSIAVFACDAFGVYFRSAVYLSGCFGVLSGLGAFYCAFGDLTNEVYARNIVPLWPNHEHAQDYAHQDDYWPRRHAHKAATAIPSV